MSRVKVLICEDDESIAQLTCRALEKENFETAVAGNTRDALTAIQSFQPNIILLDLYLPEAGGPSILREIKSDPLIRHLPVILFSAEDDLERIAKLIQADGFIQKPFEVKELITTARRFCA